MKKKGVLKIVSQKRAWYERLLAAVFFSLAVYVIFMFYKNVSLAYSEKYYINSFKTLAGLIFLVGMGLKFSATLNHHFDFNLMRYRAYWSAGFFGFGKWEYIRTLKRVTTFLNPRGECEVTIWDIKNNRYKIASFNKINDAVTYGRNLAEKLEITFLERE
ncbi:MAG: hypothetical protein V3V28_01420 [Polaribacter sp.]|uniref:hypothetical protein n=1 Tax=Polaribacter sp. TaxID=1920175 RepID=UPI002F35A8EB